MSKREWEEAVARVWGNAEREEGSGLVARMREALADLPAEAPEALFEVASAHDYVGQEERAVGFYERALAGGLSGRRRDEAVIQLASSLRNVGRPADAVALLRRERVSQEFAGAASAFEALAVWDAGDKAEALRLALGALDSGQYSRAVSRYAAGLETDLSSPDA